MSRRKPVRKPFRSTFIALTITAVVAATIAVGTHAAEATVPFPVASLNGSGNNITNPTWGQAGTTYLRVGPVRYGNGRSTPVGDNVNVRNLSNRVFNDINQNVFSERDVSQWVWTWGQFIDHTIGLAQGGTEAANIPFSASDPLEDFTNTLGVIPFTRD